MKVKVPNSNFTGVSHGLKFVDGISEDFKSRELLGRLKRKGYAEAKASKREELLTRCAELGIDVQGLDTNEKLKKAISATEGGEGGA